jgi:hypothetical protein
VQAMMSVLPDWVVEKLGVGKAEPVQSAPTPVQSADPPAVSMEQSARQVEQAKAQAYQGARAPDPVEGKIVVEIVGDGAANARVRQSKSTGIGLETSLRTGPSLAGMGAG